MNICKNSGIFYKQILIQNTGRLKTFRRPDIIFTVATYAERRNHVAQQGRLKKLSDGLWFYFISA